MVESETPRLFHIILRYVNDDEAARSLVQETFLQAYKNLDSFRGDSQLTSWVTGIGINLARSWLRKNKRQQPMDEETMERLQPDFRFGRYTGSFEPWDPEQTAERAERKELVHKALDELSDSYREVIVLRDLEERSTKETAELLGISRGAVRVRLHRARQALRSLLDPHFASDFS
ncbi:RNA polymerase subunit sigma-24 [Longimonas halophila]|uniref:RNA polymerase subunit sigma-24 n=2 Tax=Longimonas halophila TaxID=1469170 RepID=A0A2H3NII3_9BACT|nr:RNA polymerase subunit sigma-24 [Longimonas halophila]